MSMDQLRTLWEKVEEADLVFVATVRIIQTKYNISEEDATRLYVTSDGAANAQVRYFRSLDAQVWKDLPFITKLRLLFWH